ncbi:MAG: hypothetical protein ABIR32_14940 [Ilumatobacteraceae bacterium]
MKKIIIAGVSALCLLTACGVDKEGTGDKLVQDIEKQAGVTLTTTQKDCLKEVVKGMSDDEITNISENKASAADLGAFQENVAGCLSDLQAGDGTVTDETTGS